MNDPKRVLIVALGLPLLIGLGFIIKEAIDDGGEKNARLYNTAIQVTETDRFNYAIDSHQGRILGYGELKATEAVKFPEMTQSFAYVDKNKEEYVQKTREVCETHYRTETRTRTVSNSDGTTSTETYTEEVPYEVCHTETYYEWDLVDSEEVSTPAYKLHGRDYPASTFKLGSYERRAEACDFTPKNTAGWLQDKNGCDGGYFYTDGTTRYYYRVIDLSLSGGFLADVSDGSLKSISGGPIDLRKSTPEEMIKEANDYHLPGNIFIVMWILFAVAGIGVLAYGWVMSDGLWSIESPSDKIKRL